MKLTFLGANRNVTGSRYCLEVGGKRVMIDCGLRKNKEEQGQKNKKNKDMHCNLDFADTCDKSLSEFAENGED